MAESVSHDSARGAVTPPALVEVLTTALAEIDDRDRWNVHTDGVWQALRPDGYPDRGQGWKLHVSATPSSAANVLAATLPVLLAGDSAFKFARSVEQVAALNARHAPRGSSGKYMTVYPSSDDEAVRLAAELHAATAGLTGPRVLSDQPYLPGSLVHYRYGAFAARRALSNDGMYSWLIYDPDGNPVQDRRVGQYLPPSWTSCPFPQSRRAEPKSGSGAPGPHGRDQGVCIGDRFQVREAIRYVNKGGVYRARDTETGAAAIIKEARPHVAENADGRDVRTLLRAEAEALRMVASLGIAPRVLKLFEHSGHVFLAEEQVTGVPLHRRVLDRIAEAGWSRHLPNAAETARLLAELMAAAHRAGLILRDFTPSNIMVRPDGTLRLIDLELAVPAGRTSDCTTGVGTFGYGAPEQMAGSAPAFSADHYSLGATICFVLTGNAPVFLAESPPARTVAERFAEWLAVRGDGGEIPVWMQRLVLALIDDEPGRRISAAAAAELLAHRAAEPGDGRAAAEPAVHGSPADGVDEQLVGHAIESIVDHLLATMVPDDGERLWPTSTGLEASDPCAVHLGAAGVLGVLTRAFELTGDARLPAALGAAGWWLAKRSVAEPQRPPGLYFGAAGTAWTLFETGRSIGDGQLAERGLRLAWELPPTWTNPDLTHGTAGVALTRLHLWRRTGDDELAAGLTAAADALVAAAAPGADGLIWATPAGFDSRLAGGRYYGFSHGTAGVGDALLAVGRATAQPGYLELATRAGDSLLAAAVLRDGEDGPLALWGAGPGDEPTAPYWCHGSAGIGSFLARLYRLGGDERFARYAACAARAVLQNSWRGVLGQCHGLAGNGECLLDIAEQVGPSERAWCEQAAGQLARLILSSRAYRNGLMVFPDERTEVSASWADGMAGILAFLLRWRYRSPRLWTVHPADGGTP